jgi:hypothetical protein
MDFKTKKKLCRSELCRSEQGRRALCHAAQGKREAPREKETVGGHTAGGE